MAEAPNEETPIEATVMPTDPDGADGISRYRASFYHFAISLGVFVVFAYFILFRWYPDFFYSIDGGWEGMRIIIGVDLILGPLLTLVVFKSGKPGLKFDLAMIGITQSVCLLAGVFVVYSERPIFFIYYEKHFYSSSADTFAKYGVLTPNPSNYSDVTPARVISVLPENPIEQADFLKVLYQTNIPPWVYEPTYQALGDHIDQILQEGIEEKVIQERDDDGNLDNWLTEQGGTFDDYTFIPIHSRYRDAFLGLRKSDKSFVGIVEIQPPK
ncbi:MAG: hypothetical protein ABGY96_16935 [bacterium]|nr:hypothetical protein [Gammaproteobacteria bacterium]